MKIAFVGNTFHDKTRSSIFFQDILRSLSDRVDLFNADNTGVEMDNDETFRDVLAGDYDLIVCWQCEHFAVRLTPFTRNVVLIPMWDAARFREAPYWQRLRTVPIIAFSRDLHVVLQRQGCETHYFQFFPDPDAVGALAPSDAIWSRGFFWERRPKEAWSAGIVCAIAESMGLDQLHVHMVSDFGDEPTKIDFRGELSTSAWFDQWSEFQELKRSFGVFFAPRDYEGIGHSFLEALAQGQCVISPNRSTASDYITSGVNGFLVDPEEFPEFDGTRVAELGAAARQFCYEGYREWMADQDRLRDLLLGVQRRSRYRERIDTLVNEGELSPPQDDRAQEAGDAGSAHPLHRHHHQERWRRSDDDTVQRQPAGLPGRF